MSRYRRQRLLDMQASLDAIDSHVQHGDISDGLVFDAVRVRLIETGEPVKALSSDVLGTDARLPGRRGRPARDRPAGWSGNGTASDLGALDCRPPGAGRGFHVAGLADRLPETGLWPLLLRPLAGDDRRPWDVGELEPVREADIEAIDPAPLLATQWADCLVPRGEKPYVGHLRWLGTVNSTGPGEVSAVLRS